MQIQRKSYFEIGKTYFLEGFREFPHFILPEEWLVRHQPWRRTKLKAYGSRLLIRVIRAYEFVFKI
jgi:hypothetical protein